MSDPTTLPSSGDEPAISPQRVRLRALMLLVLMAALLAGGAYYLLHIRGAFTKWQPLYLICEDSEGISVGMEMTFVGFPIGRVREIRPTRDKDGNVRARVHVDIRPRVASRWLRTSSVFVLEKNIVGAARLRAITNVPDDPPLPSGSERNLLRGDLSAELPQLLAQARALLDNLVQLTSAESALSGALLDVQEITQRLAASGQGGLLATITGNEQDAERLSRLLESSETLVRHLDTLAKNANAQVLGPKGLTRDAQAAMRQLQKLLDELRGSMNKLDAVLGDAKAISGNVQGATTNLQELRDEVDANLQRAETMMNSLSRRWPFATGSDKNIRLP